MAGRYENPNSLPPLMIRYTTLLDEENIKYRPPAFKRTLRLSDVRQILLQSAIIHPEDVFADQNGYLIAKDAEKSLKLSDIMSPTSRVFCMRETRYRRLDDMVDINNASNPGASRQIRNASEDFQSFNGDETSTVGQDALDVLVSHNVDMLSPQERAALISSALLGRGVDLSKDETSCYRMPVIASVQPTEVDIVSLNSSHISSVVTKSPHATSYAAAGWFEACVTAESTWADGSIKSDGSTSSPLASPDGYQSCTTGRFSYSMCRLSLPYDLKPHPSLEKAIMSALDQKDVETRYAALRAVFAKWGFFFVGGVVMGGVKYMSSTGKSVEATNVTLRTLMETALSKGLGGMAYKDTQQPFQQDKGYMFDGDIILTRGGHVNTSSIDAWIASLNNWRLWRPTRPSDIRSVLELFDKEIQDQIRATELAHSSAKQHKTISQPIEKAVPLHRTSFPNNHFYTNDKSEVDHYTGRGHTYEGVVGRVFCSPETGTVPLFRTWNGSRNFYTADPVELDFHIQNYGAIVEKHAGYVFTTHVEGTIPLYHAYKEDGWDNLFTTDRQEMDRVCHSAGFRDCGITCYIFPA